MTMRTGMTLKQFARSRFFAALDDYKCALRTGNGIIKASLAVHAASGGVPKRWRVFINQAFKSKGKA